MLKWFFSLFIASFIFFLQMIICDQFTWIFFIFLSQLPWFILTFTSSLYSHRSYTSQWFYKYQNFIFALPFSKTLKGFLFFTQARKNFWTANWCQVSKECCFVFLISTLHFLCPKVKSKSIVYFRWKHLPKQLMELMLAKVLPSRRMNFVGTSRPYSKLVSSGFSVFLVANDPHDCYCANNFLLSYGVTSLASLQLLLSAISRKKKLKSVTPLFTR